MDFLGLKTLTLIDDALGTIEQATGSRPDLERLPLDDPKVYELFARARTSGVFQFESGGMKDILRRLKPERFEDLVALNALYRPGPIGGGLIDDFIKRRHGKVKVEYPHPVLEDILRDTYGVIVYQEQVMQIASRMAGYSLGEADILRRAMGKKKKDVMAAERKKFVEGAKANDIGTRESGKVFELMEFFAGYGFNKSHSAAYALVAYHTAWLKAHHPVHFMAALLTTEKGNTDKLVSYVNESREMNIEVLPPDVYSSGLDFTVEGEKIRFGLSAIKNVGEGAIRAILEAREAKDSFHSLHEMCAETDSRIVNKRALDALVKSGAFDSQGARRSQLAAVLDAAIDYGQKCRADRDAGQSSLFGAERNPAGDAPLKECLPDIPEWDETTRLTHEKATLGFYVTGHPLESHRDLLAEFGTHTTVTLKEATAESDGEVADAVVGEVAVIGIITDLKRRKSKKTGSWWASMLLEDLEGLVEVLVFPKTYEACQKTLDNDRAVLVKGRLESDEDRVKITASSVAPMESLREANANAVQVRLEAGELDDALVDRLRGAVSAHRGEVQLYFEVARRGSYSLVAKAEPAMRVCPSTGLTRDLEAVVGTGRVRYKGPRPSR
jgi:DNA polymerase-3 subunit alpha